MNQILRYKKNERSQTRWIQTDPHQNILIEIAKVKEKILMVRKKRVSYKGTPPKLSWFLYRSLAGQKGVAKYTQSSEREIPTT